MTDEDREEVRKIIREEELRNNPPMTPEQAKQGVIWFIGMPILVIIFILSLEQLVLYWRAH